MKATYILNEDNGNVNTEIESLDQDLTTKLSPNDAIKVCEMIFNDAIKISQEAFKQWLLAI